MAFDAGMLAEVISEIKNEALGAKTEKIQQPEKDQIIISMRSQSGGRKLLIDAGSNNPRLGFTFRQKENPASPPMFCMLLRKHLTGAKLIDITQPSFERVAVLTFETYDEMGFKCNRSLIAEIMGKYSNLIFADENGKVIASLKTVDFSTSSKRQIIPGIKYELPPKQEKDNPLEATESSFAEKFECADKNRSADKFIASEYLGISASLAREIAFRATRHTDTPLSMCDQDELWKAFSGIMNRINNGEAEPCMVYDENDKPTEYSFINLTHYGKNAKYKFFDTLGELLDAFFEERDKEMRIKQRASDILHLLTSAESRLIKKIGVQEEELAECEKGEKYKEYGDLITANIYLLSRGMKSAELTDYATQNPDGTFKTVKIELDEKLSPAANAQKMYKKYAKLKTAKTVLAKQIQIARTELEYIYTVFDSLTRAETATDLAEIRDELHFSGYASKMKSDIGKKQVRPTVMKFRTSGGYTVLCGKNNMQNEYITHKLAEKNDYWFHAKDVPGSHVILVTGGDEPAAENFTEAAEIAAFYSKASGQNIPVDYTFARNVKKTPASKPGLVIYHTNWTAYVTPDSEKIAAKRIK